MRRTARFLLFTERNLEGVTGGNGTLLRRWARHLYKAGDSIFSVPPAGPRFRGPVEVILGGPGLTQRGLREAGFRQPISFKPLDDECLILSVELWIAQFSKECFG